MAEIKFPEPEPPVKTLQRPEEFARLLEIYQQKQPKYVLEIGSFAGGTLWYWLKYAQKGATIISVDLPVESGQLSEQERGRRMWHEWVNEEREIHFKSFYECSTRDRCFENILAWNFPDGIDFAFIDGGHDYITVQSDVEMVLRKMNQNGVLALHDIHTPSNEEIQVQDFWQDLLIKIPVRIVRSIEEIGDTHKLQGGIGSGIGVLFT